MSGKNNILIIITIIICLTCVIYIFGQCAMCKATLETSPEGQKMAKNFNNAILLLLTAPYLVLGITAYKIYKNSKTNK